MTVRYHFLLLITLSLISLSSPAQADLTRALAHRILRDTRMDTIQSRALRLLTGFTAGTSYGEVWVRDLNTFINGSLRVHRAGEVKDMLLLFCKIQGADGNIPDGAIHKEQANVGYQYRYSDLAPGWAVHKNTVETDQESSLIQAVKKYIVATGDRSILDEKVGALTVLQRLQAALEYVLKERWSDQYGLVKGATTVDWGDMQAQTGWGVALNDKTKWAIDIYDNAMFASAIMDLTTMLDAAAAKPWQKKLREIKKNIRRHLWDAKAGKYIPHLYLDGSPFSSAFDEKPILYTGGSACAILAGLHTKEEIRTINRQMVAAAAKEPHATIGITVWPPYPLEAFPNVPPYTYQNGGDWTWFGGRMVQALTDHGLVEEAYAELSPMLDRVLSHHGFFEWYDVRTGEAKGSGDFRGEAGVLYDAIAGLRKWAENNAQ